MIEAVTFIHDPRNMQDVMESLKKHLRLSRTEDAEASYKLLRLMTTVDIGPNPEAFKSAQKILLRLNPKIGQVELERIVDGSLVRSLEESGFLPQMRKRMGSYLRP